MSVQSVFLLRALRAAQSAHHIFPAYAACESALESGWGQSRLAVEANNLFGQKQSHPPLADTETISMPTREYLHAHWMTVSASWAKFPDWNACFAARMELLRRLSEFFPHYQAAFHATNGEQYVIEVSQTWSTDPQRAGKVLAIFDAHADILQPQPVPVVVYRAGPQIPPLGQPQRPQSR